MTVAAARSPTVHGSALAILADTFSGKLANETPRSSRSEVLPVVDVLGEERLVEAVLGAVGGRHGLDIDVLRAATRLQPRQRRLDRVPGEEPRDDEVHADRDEHDQHELTDALQEVGEEFARHEISQSAAASGPPA